MMVKVSQDDSEERGAARSLVGLEIAQRGQRIPDINWPRQTVSLLESSGMAMPSNSTVSSAAAGFLF